MKKSKSVVGGNHEAEEAASDTEHHEPKIVKSKKSHASTRASHHQPQPEKSDHHQEMSHKPEENHDAHKNQDKDHDDHKKHDKGHDDHKHHDKSQDDLKKHDKGHDHDQHPVGGPSPSPSAAKHASTTAVSASPSSHKPTTVTSSPSTAAHGDGQPEWVTKLIGMEEVTGNWKETIRMLESEFWGTFFLVFLGVGSCMNWTEYGAPQNSLVSISLTFGLAVATVAQMLGHVSGAHLNPAVSFGLVAAGDCGLAKACLYFPAQTFGSFMGSMLAMAVLHPGFMGGGPGITGSLSKLNGVTSGQGLLNECFITFPLIFTICAVSDKGNDFKGSAPLAIGLSITLGHLVGIPCTGSSMNPSRAIGPLLAASMFKRRVSVEAQSAIAKASKDLWVYLIGPILGGILAGLLYRFRYSSKHSPKSKEKQE